MNIITSTNNNKLKEIRKLSRRRYREETGLFIIEGLRGVREVLEYEDRVAEIYGTKDMLSELNLSGNNVYQLDEDLFDSISTTVSPQGILATVNSEIKSIDQLVPGRYIYLDGVQDPGNLGGIIRGVDAFGLDGIIVGPGTVDPTNDKVTRSTVASIMRVGIYKSSGIDDLKTLKNSHTIYATDLDDSSVIIKDVDYSTSSVIVIGNEGSGVSSEVLGLADKRIHIPMAGDAESLNANVAASIIMYEMIR